MNANDYSPGAYVPGEARNIARLKRVTQWTLAWIERLRHPNGVLPKLWPVWAAILVGMVVRNSAFYLNEITSLFGHNDFRLYYAGAEVGLRYGWSRIYDVTLHQAAVAALQPSGPWYAMLTPAPITWLVAPLTLLGYPTAYWVWVVLSLVALGAAVWYARPRGHSTMIYFLWWAALSPLWFSAYEGQVTILAAAAVLTGWRLLESRRDFLAGAILALALFKPYLILLLPLALLVAGRFRALLSFALVAAAAGLAMLLTLHPEGIRTYLETLMAPQAVGDMAETLRFALGGGPYVLAIQVAAVIAVIAVAVHARRTGTTWPFVVAALFGSFLLASYWHPQDYLLLDVAAAVTLAAGPLEAGVLAAAASAVLWAPATPPLSNRVMIMGWLLIATAFLGFLTVRALRQSEPRRQPATLTA